MLRLGHAALTFSLLFPARATPDDWTEWRSSHFTLVTNAGKGTTRNILTDLEQLRRLIAELLPAQPVTSPTPAVFFVFNNGKSFAPFKPLRDGTTEDWVAAYFRSPGFKSFVAIEASSSKESIRELVFQQYLHLILSYTDFDYPVWLENGISLFYANAHVSKDFAEIGKMHDRHRRELGEFRSIPIRDLFGVGYGSPQYRDPSQRDLFDAQCWAVIHYFFIGRSPEGSRELTRFMELLAEGRNSLLAFQEAVGRPLTEIDDEVSGYIRRRLYQYMKVKLTPLDAEKEFLSTELSPALADARLGELLIAVGRLDEAEELLERSLEADSSLAEAYEGLGFLAWTKRDPERTRRYLEQAVEKGSENPLVHYYYARTVLGDYLGGHVPEIPESVRVRSKQALGHVLERAPEHADAARLYGFVCLFDPSDTQAGIAAVERALMKHRGHVTLLFILGQLHVKQQDFDAARAVFEALLKRELEPGLVAGIRGQLDYIDTRTRR